MKVLAAAVSLSLALAPAAGAATPPPATVAISTESETGISTITVTASRDQLEPGQRSTLKAVRAGGAGAAVGGVGLLAYAIAFEAAGPVGWAAGLIFFGGMAAYLSHRRLHGHEDLSPDEARRSGPATVAP